VGRESKSKSHAPPAIPPTPAAQPGAQADAGLRFWLRGEAFPPRRLARALGTVGFRPIHDIAFLMAIEGKNGKRMQKTQTWLNEWPKGKGRRMR